MGATSDLFIINISSLCLPLCFSSDILAHIYRFSEEFHACVQWTEIKSTLQPASPSKFFKTILLKSPISFTSLKKNAPSPRRAVPMCVVGGPSTEVRVTSWETHLPGNRLCRWQLQPPRVHENTCPVMSRGLRLSAVLPNLRALQSASSLWTFL